MENSSIHDQFYQNSGTENVVLRQEFAKEFYSNGLNELTNGKVPI